MYDDEFELTFDLSDEDKASRAPEPEQEPVQEAAPEPAAETEPPVEAVPEPAVPAANGRCVLISGGDRGIGAAAARAFWQAGYRVAVLAQPRFDTPEEMKRFGRPRLGFLVSGGNIDVNILSRVITRGLVMSGRKANLTIALEDKPGQLQRVAEIVSRCGSNVVSVLHDGSDPNMPISSCFLKLTLETRDAAQIEQIRAELTKEGFQLVSERV